MALAQRVCIDLFGRLPRSCKTQLGNALSGGVEGTQSTTEIHLVTLGSAFELNDGYSGSFAGISGESESRRWFPRLKFI